MNHVVIRIIYTGYYLLLKWFITDTAECNKWNSPLDTPFGLSHICSYCQNSVTQVSVNSESNSHFMVESFIHLSISGQLRSKCAVGAEEEWTLGRIKLPGEGIKKTLFGKQKKTLLPNLREFENSPEAIGKSVFFCSPKKVSFLLPLGISAYSGFPKRDN